MISKRSSGRGKRAVAGAGLALAAAGAYFLYKTKPKERKKVLKNLLMKVKKEAVKRYVQGKEMGEGGYKKTAHRVMREYRALKNIDPKEFQAIGKELASHWKHIKKAVAAGRKKAK